MSPLLVAAFAGGAHMLLGSDRLFVLLALGALRRCASESLTIGVWWALGHVFGLLVINSHILPWWHEAVEWNMYVSGIILCSFGIHVCAHQHGYSSHHSESEDLHENLRKAEWTRISNHLTSWYPESEVEPLDCKRVHQITFADVVPMLVASALGVAQGVVSPDFAYLDRFSTGEGLVLAMTTYLVCAAVIIMISCVATYTTWSFLMSWDPTSWGLRAARRTIGKVLVATGIVWLIITIKTDALLADVNAVGGGRIAAADCPTPAAIGNVKFDSAPTWSPVSQLDTWWTQELVEQYRRPPLKAHIAKSNIGGCGLVATEDLLTGSRVGLAAVLSSPWDVNAALVHVTPWLGIAVNHCGIASNSKLRKEAGLVYLETIKPIAKGQEITFNYDLAANLIPIERANPTWTC